MTRGNRKQAYVEGRGFVRGERDREADKVSKSMKIRGKSLKAYKIDPVDIRVHCILEKIPFQGIIP
jgi:hypothetical protein